MSDNNQTVSINFYGQELITVEQNGSVFVAMKPIVEGMGMSWGAQQQKLRNNLRYETAILHVRTHGRIRKMVCIPKSDLDKWMSSVNPEKRKNPSEYEENRFRDQLANFLAIRKWKIETEKKTPFGNIDILASLRTRILVIECKRTAAGASSALGQLLFYKEAYPKAKLVLGCPRRMNKYRRGVFDKYGISIIRNTGELEKIL